MQGLNLLQRGIVARVGHADSSTVAVALARKKKWREDSMDSHSFIYSNLDHLPAPRLCSPNEHKIKATATDSSHQSADRHKASPTTESCPYIPFPSLPFHSISKLRRDGNKTKHEKNATKQNKTPRAVNPSSYPPTQARMNE